MTRDDDPFPALLSGRTHAEIVSQARHALRHILCPPGWVSETLEEAVLVARGLAWLRDAPDDDVLTAYAYVETPRATRDVSLDGSSDRASEGAN